MRIYLFLFGLMMGCLLLVFFLKKKGTAFSYLPNARVLSQLRKKKIRYAPEIKSTDSLLCQEILRRGEVLFGQSVIGEKKCNEYKIQLNDPEPALISVELCDSTAFIKELWRR